MKFLKFINDRLKWLLNKPTEEDSSEPVPVPKPIEPPIPVPVKPIDKDR